MILSNADQIYLIWNKIAKVSAYDIATINHFDSWKPPSLIWDLLIQVKIAIVAYAMISGCNFDKLYGSHTQPHIRILAVKRLRIQCYDCYHGACRMENQFREDMTKWLYIKRIT